MSVPTKLQDRLLFVHQGAVDRSPPPCGQPSRSRYVGHEKRRARSTCRWTDSLNVTFSLLPFLALPGQIISLLYKVTGTLPGCNAHLLHQGPEVTFRLGPNIRGDVTIPPPNTTPTATTAVLITDPAGVVGPRSRKSSSYVTLVMPRPSGKRC